MADPKVDFSVRMDSVMDIFRRTDMKVVSKDVLKRMNDTVEKPVKKTEADWVRAFYSGLGEPDDKDQLRHKRQLIKSIITKKTADSFTVKDVNSVMSSSSRYGSMPEDIADKVEDSTWVMKAKLFSNFKALNEGVQNTMEYKLPTSEIMESVKDQVFSKAGNMDQNMRKKFLQEKIELLLRLAIELREAEKVRVVQNAKIDIVRDAIHYRYLCQDSEEKNIQEIKKTGVLSLNNVRMNNLMSDGSTNELKRRSTLRRKKHTDSQIIENFNDANMLDEYFQPKDSLPADLQESTMIFSRHLLVQKRLSQEISMLKEDLSNLIEKKKKFDTRVLL